MPKTNGHPTYQEVLALFDRTDRQIAETRRGIDELRKSGQETDRRIAESVQETDRRFKELQKELREEVSRVTRQVGELTNHWGSTIEGLASPSTGEALKREGFTISDIFPNAETRRNGDSMEVDVLLVGKHGPKPAVFLVEVRTQLRAGDVNDLREKIDRFPKFFTRYADCERVGILCGVKVPKDVAVRASRVGFYVMSPSGDAFEITARPDRS